MRSRYRIWLDLGIRRRHPNLLGRRMRPRPRGALTETVIRPVTDSRVEVERGTRGSSNAPESCAHASIVLDGPTHRLVVLDLAHGSPLRSCWTGCGVSSRTRGSHESQSLGARHAPSRATAQE